MEISGNVKKDAIPFLWWSTENVDAKLKMHVVILDIYDWHKGLSVYYPPYKFGGNEILDQWAENLEKYGSARSFIARGDHTYTKELTDIGAPNVFFNANEPPGNWVNASCIGSQFDIDGSGPGTIDYCGNPMR